MEYDGIDDPDTFIQDFKITAIYQKWDETAQLTHFPVFLKGKALRVYTACQEKDTIAICYNAVIAGCKPPNESLLINFFHRTLKQDESISKHALELQELLQLAMPDLQVGNRTSLLRAHLSLSLPKELQTLVNFTADNLSWDNLLVKLDQMDAQRQTNRTLNPSYASSSYSGPSKAAVGFSDTDTLIKTESFYADTQKNTNFNRNSYSNSSNNDHNRSNNNRSNNGHNRNNRSNIAKKSSSTVSTVVTKATKLPNAGLKRQQKVVHPKKTNLRIRVIIIKNPTTLNLTQST